MFKSLDTVESIIFFVWDDTVLELPTWDINIQWEYEKVIDDNNIILIVRYSNKKWRDAAETSFMSIKSKFNGAGFEFYMFNVNLYGLRLTLMLS